VDSLAGCAFPLPGPDAFGKFTHSIEYVMNIISDILPIDHECLIVATPKGGVQDRAVLGVVELTTHKHRIASREDSALLRECPKG
jgi:hypothetical protein